ncbi:FAR-17a/AIG1-like protein [Caenorhabditis elegans]|uniref:FAR-17a/AIG1-like protein n=1 Tax=Caenorhabditis elegans TaxID=6239 RepID=Q93355_CAEEL|nr:FAR-17a/AIG1-like protein [Caenorhabditis elegans]CAB02824.2 FAR-17a/AIG1-like protein [Caenorhabditis elegans]|eukprot:NP_510364.2 Uncharacterized protein CELE_C37E2.3 [Caenorhabditis elegans]
MSKGSFLLFPVLCVVWLAALCFDFLQQPRLNHSWYIYKLILLTNLAFVLNVVYSTLVVIGYKSKTIKEVVDFMHFTAMFPVAVILCGMFWGFYVYDSDLVMPAWVAEIVPSWLNHINHTYLIVFILLDSYYHKRDAPSNSTSWMISVVYVTFYFIIVLGVKYYNRMWVYPVLQSFSIDLFVISYILSVVIFFILLKAACKLNRQFHKSILPSEKTE